ncbi:Myb/SANT-like domain [Dillenia turbinata]|uniref:Myb/SANT-like domain n=1 Tax=Dillenia turbinata TaxID=194707 RepID=A0AAN8VRR1_9MAGN
MTWTHAMDDALVDAFMHQYDMGNKMNGTFITKAYENIVKELIEKFGEWLNKEKVRNRWKTIKKNFSEPYDIFKNGLSGFAWNPTTQLWSAKTEVWEKLIESKPQAKNWMSTPIPNYEKLVILYGNDRATGDHVETASELKKRQSVILDEDYMNTIDGIDNLTPRMM